MPILNDIGRIYCCKEENSTGATNAQAAVHEIEGAVLVWEADKILWLGKASDLPSEYQAFEKISANGCAVTPGFIDCHTHLVFGGWRADEFEKRILGTSYLEIAKAGGGILSTVKATRAASDIELKERAHKHLQKILKLGVTCVECKSGYGLNLEDEIRILKLVSELNDEQPIKLIPTFLGAHTVPPEYKTKRTEYLELLTSKALPAIAKEKLARFCDIFIEDSAFSIEEARSLLNAAKSFDLKPRVHVDQLEDGGGALFAAEIGAISADHLEFISKEGIKALAKSNTIAVSLPIASLYTFQKALDARPLIKAGIPVALSTDFNPGSAPSYNLPLAMLLGCTLNRMTPKEVLKAVTIYAAKALCEDKERGSLEVNKQADFVILDAPGIDDWLYHFREGVVKAVYKDGKLLHSV